MLPTTTISVKHLECPYTLEDSSNIEAYANTILDLGGLLEPLFVVPTPKGTYTLAYEYQALAALAVLRARELDPEEHALINVFIMDGTVSPRMAAYLAQAQLNRQYH